MFNPFQLLHHSEIPIGPRILGLAKEIESFRSIGNEYCNFLSSSRFYTLFFTHLSACVLSNFPSEQFLYFFSFPFLTPWPYANEGYLLFACFLHSFRILCLTPFLYSSFWVLLLSKTYRLSRIIPPFIYGVLKLAYFIEFSCNRLGFTRFSREFFDSSFVFLISRVKSARARGN